MKRTVGIVVLLYAMICATVLAACAPTDLPLLDTEDSPIMDTAAPQTPMNTPLPATPTPPLPTASPTLPPLLQQDWRGIYDNGIDGVGSIRGNTNGNLWLHGRAVLAPDAAYYVDYNTETEEGVWGVTLFRYNRSTQKRETILVLDYAAHFDIEYLNWYANKLWFVLKRKDVFTYDPETKTLECVFEGSERARITNLILAYDIVFVAVSRQDYQSELFQGTLCLDVQTGEIVYAYERFAVWSIMDGRLYGYLYTQKGSSDWSYCSMLPDGSDIKECAPFDLAVDGKLYSWTLWEYENDEGQTVDGTAILITNVADGSEYLYVIPENFRFEGIYNVSHDYLYLQHLGANNVGGVYRVLLTDYSWLGRWGVKDYYWGVTLLDDEPAKWYASRCDLWFTESP